MKRPKVVSAGALNRVNQRDCAAVETIKGCLEDLSRLIPRVRDTAAFLEPRIKITGDDNPGGIHAKADGNLACLICVHDNDEIRLADRARCKRPRTIPREVEPSPRADHDRDLGNRPIAPEESCGRHRGAGERALKHRL
jgi:hypothetical protein